MQITDQMLVQRREREKKKKKKKKKLKGFLCQIQNQRAREQKAGVRKWNSGCNKKKLRERRDDRISLTVFHVACVSERRETGNAIEKIAHEEKERDDSAVEKK